MGVRFQVSFTPLVGVLFTFPSRYSCTIGRRGVFRLGGWSPHVQTGFHVPRPTRGPLRALRLRGCHPLRRTFPDPSASFAKATGLLRFRSPLLAESPLMSFPPGTEMFQFPGLAPRAYGFGAGSPKREGFPHSDIRGSTIARISPRLFAACHVLHRLLAPRHPPNALFTLRASKRPETPKQTPPPARRAEPRRPGHKRRRTPPAADNNAPAAHTQYTQSLFTCERTPAAPAPRGRRNNGHGFGGKTGGDRVRTDDPLLAKQVLSRLSYAPAATAKRAGDGTGHERDGPGRT